MKIQFYFLVILLLIVTPHNKINAESSDSKNIYQNQINWLL